MKLGNYIRLYISVIYFTKIIVKVDDIIRVTSSYMSGLPEPKHISRQLLELGSFGVPSLI
jgi:hypothetical protein